MPKIQTDRNESSPVPAKATAILILNKLILTKRLTYNGKVLFIVRCVQRIIFHKIMTIPAAKVRPLIFCSQSGAFANFTTRTTAV